MRGAVWQEIDLDAKHWTIPAARMKAGREHRVPLSPDAIKLLKALRKDLPQIVGSDLVFPALIGGSLSDMTLAAVIKRMHEAETKAGRKGYLDPKEGKVATPHGTARSTFRDWVGEKTNFPREVAEMALAHAFGGKVERDYWRGDLFDKRRALMNAWAEFCSHPKSGNVVSIHAKAAQGNS